MEAENAIMVSCEGSDALRRNLRLLALAQNTTVAKLVRESVDAHLGEKIAAIAPSFFAQSDAGKHQNGVAKRHSKKGGK